MTALRTLLGALCGSSAQILLGLVFGAIAAALSVPLGWLLAPLEGR